MEQDRHQDIARSSYADMLHDDERNHLYNHAMKTAVKHLIKSKRLNPTQDRFYKCCDIGAGSGLLSMMVARSFLEQKYTHFQITAYECFAPMSAVAKAVIEANGYSKYITVETERVGDNSNYPNPQFDLLVAELLDTELIGEGCLLVYRFAIEKLCSPDCIFVPSEARIFIEPLSSRGLFRRQIFRDHSFACGTGEISIEFDNEVKSCSGLSELDDMQTSNLRDSYGFERVVDQPQVAFEFKFNQLNSLKLNDTKIVHFKTKQKLDQELVVHMWWDLIMLDETIMTSDPDSPISSKYPLNRLSIAPTWCRNRQQRERDNYIGKHYKRSIWREHWMQAIYHIPCHEATRSLLGKTRNEDSLEFDLHANHDAYCLWFDLVAAPSGRHQASSSPSSNPDQQLVLPTSSSCTCGYHRRLNRYEVSFLNGSTILQDLIKAALSISVGRHQMQRQSLKAKLRMIDSPEMSHKWRLDFYHSSDSEFNVNPVFSLWDLSLMDDISWLVILSRFMQNQDIKPIASFKIVYNQVAFQALNRIRTRVGSNCEGFDLTNLDELIESSANRCDTTLEAHHLWEYQCDVLGPEMVIFDSERQQQQQQQQQVSNNEATRIYLRDSIELDWPKVDQWPVETLRAQWALVVSCNIKLLNGKIIKTGLVDSSSSSGVGSPVKKWNHHFKQLVHFLHQHPALNVGVNSEETNRPIKLKLELNDKGLSIKWL